MLYCTHLGGKSLKETDLSVRTWVLAVFLPFTVFTAALTFAQGESPRQAVVLILIRSSDKSETPDLRSLLSDSIRLEIENRGMLAIEETAAPAGQNGVSGDSSSIVLDDVFNAAESADADFCLLGAYTVKEKEVTLDIQWLEVSERRVAARTSRAGTLDLSFDSMVVEAMNEIIEGQKERIASLPPLITTEPESEPEKEPAAEEVAIQPVASLPPTPEQEAETGTDTLVVEAPAAPREIPPEPRVTSFAFALSSAPFIATFEAAKYFALGFSASFAGDYYFHTTGGLAGLGLTAGIHRFHGKGTYAEADFTLFPIGIDFLYGTMTGSMIDFFAHANAGPAVFMAQVAGGIPQVKVVPYAMAGVGLTLSFSEMIGISMDGSYVAFFDYPTTIMGYIPSISVFLRF